MPSDLGFQHASPSLWHAAISFLIGHFQRHGNIKPWIEKQRHIGERPAHGKVLHIFSHWRRGHVGRQRQRFVRRQLERLLLDLVPDRLVDALRVALRRREEIDDQDVNAFLKEIDRLLDEVESLKREIRRKP